MSTLLLLLLLLLLLVLNSLSQRACFSFFRARGRCAVCFWLEMALLLILLLLLMVLSLLPLLLLPFSAAGTCFGTDTRVVDVDGLEIDFNPIGNMLMFNNPDSPGMLRAVASVLGDKGVSTPHVIMLHAMYLRVHPNIQHEKTLGRAYVVNHVREPQRSFFFPKKRDLSGRLVPVVLCCSRSGQVVHPRT